jgi:hypothetical protein
MYDVFVESGAPEDLGAFLHPQQDSFSHANFGPEWGHIDLRSADLGAYYDDTFFNPQSADEMARDTFDRLVEARALLGENGEPVNYGLISPFVERFNRAQTPGAKAAALRSFLNMIHRAPRPHWTPHW